jgi:hypothetical protein
MWITRACGANFFGSPVARSSKRAPIAINKSHSSMIRFVKRAPCMPSMPISNGWPVGIVPSAINVDVTGMPARSASSRNSW